ncbi:MAG TPA: EamA family transporter [Devosia sp.]|jgi:undecaprenyl phosphate-alpha-L-ara4N flippase subunit ArnE|nr:EamA family transporter [Devosia sp.]
MNLFALAIVVAANVGGQLLFKVAADDVRNEAGVLAMTVRLFAVPAMWGAVILYGITILAWVWVLRTTPLSVAYSAVALVFVLVPALAVWLFREPLTPQFALGAGLIVLGVVLVQLQAR